MQLGRIQQVGDEARVGMVAARLRRLALAFLFLGVGLVAFAVFAEAATVQRVLIGLPGAILVALSFLSLRRARGHETIPLLEVTDEGIRHSKAGLIRWDEIEDVRIYEPAGERSLGIWTRDPDLVARRANTAALRWVARVNTKLGYAPITLTESMVPLEQTLAEIQRRRGAAP